MGDVYVIGAVLVEVHPDITMRARNHRKLQKESRLAEHANPGWAKLNSQHPELYKIVEDKNCDLNFRLLAARMLRAVGRTTSAFVPLLREFIDSGDAELDKLRQVLLSMQLGRGHLTRPEFDCLSAALRTGTPDQQFCVVDQIAFFDSRRARRALIDVLKNTAAPEHVRGWAAERLGWHLCARTVRACADAAQDPSPEVRLWAVSTLGTAASWHPVYRDIVIPILESKTTDQAFAEGCWRVGREARIQLAGLRKTPDDMDRLQAEIQVILKDPTASQEDKRWAEFYDYSS